MGGGVLLSPTSRGERRSFSEYVVAVSTFLGGFLAAKLERVFELTVKETADVTELLIARLLLFVSAFVLGGLLTFIWRKYIST